MFLNVVSYIEIAEVFTGSIISADWIKSGRLIGKMTNNKKPRRKTVEQHQLFHEGSDLHSYQHMGAHIVKQEGVKGVRFRVWAPNAEWVSVVGDFNRWDTDSHTMIKISHLGIWELFVPELGQNQLYKYAIGTHNNEILLKSDPYAFYSELRPATASIVYDLKNYRWNDELWQSRKKDTPPYHKPMLIYEVHIGSWKRKEDQGFLSYRELAHELVDYVVEMGYTHIELLPIMEHPFDGSWGYQVTGYFAVTSRYGTPKDFMYFVDQCHQKGIGVILDWVPAHFPKDAHGLARFDGTSLYEHEDPRKGEHQQWGTLIFNYGRYEVQSFLTSSVMFWLDYYHIDGFRIDAVASMLYLDYARDDWLPNCCGGNENLEAAGFMKKMNEAVFESFPNTLMIAEDSSEWPMVTRPVWQGGLGYNFKWNMGWMNDTLKYCTMDPVHRKWNHNLVTFSLTFAFSENFILPFSHDEVVHGKHSLLDKMPGTYEQKFAGLRSLYGFMTAHPGKKLLFMGGEFGQFIEWKFESGLDWHLLDYELHRKMQIYVKELNAFYKINQSLWEDDYSWNGFQWIVADDYDQSIFSFIRRAENKKDYLVIIVNFTPVLRQNYRIGVPKASAYRLQFNSDETRFGGYNLISNKEIVTEKTPFHNFEQSISLTIPPLSVNFYQPMDSSMNNRII
jgi:1,4-alpha-glucan branching enzyme